MNTTIRLGPPVPYPAQQPCAASMKPAAFWKLVAECSLAKLTAGRRLMMAVNGIGCQNDPALQLFLARAQISIEDEFRAAVKRHQQAGGLEAIALHQALEEIGA